MKERKRPHWIWPLCYYIGALVLFAFMWLLLRNILFDDRASLGGTLFKGIAEGAAICCWYWLLPPRYRWWLQVPIWGAGILFLSNALYFRVFADIIPISSLAMGDNFNPLFFQSTLALFLPKDIFFIILPLLLTLFYFFFRRRLTSPSSSISWQWRLIAVAASLSLWCVQQFLYVRTNKNSSFVAQSLEKDPRNPLSWSDAMNYQYRSHAFSGVSDLHDRGMVLFTVREFIRTFHTGGKDITLTPEDERGIADYFAAMPKDYPLPDEFAGRDDRNVILIIVESLNSWVVGMEVGGEKVTPVLDHYIAMPTTVAVMNVKPEIRDGGSSDGQLLYDTGLLPIMKGATVMEYTKRHYPSLATLLGKRKSWQFIGDSRRVWNYGKSSLQYGYDRLYDEEDIKEKGIDKVAMGKDKAVFEMALSTLLASPQPFFAEIITLSMHLPFKEERAPRVAAFDSSDHSDTFKDYITTTRYFDTQLGDFLERLEEEGLLEHTIVFIASDHKIFVRDGEQSHPWQSDISFIAINAGVSAPEVEGDVMQSDIFPTMLDIAGVPFDKEWRGLGVSIYADSCRRSTALPMLRRQSPLISDKLIRSNFFSSPR